MTKDKIPKISEKLSTSVFNSIVHSLFRDGTLTLADFEDEEKFKKKLLSINAKADYKIIIDHSESLIATARQFNKTGKIENAKLFYATFFEHELNGIILELCQKKSIDKKTINDIIKSVNLIGKLTWLPLVLGIPQVTVAHKNTILKLADDRNAYIHYKHNPQPDESDANNEQKEQEEIKKIEKTITYFKKYVSRILYNKQKTHLDKKLKRR
jgi:hypothetical protein